MIKVSVMYPKTEGSHFDIDYYRDTHMPLVEKHLKSKGLVKTSIDKGIGGGAPGQPPEYHCIGMLYFESEAVFREVMPPVSPILRGDIPNFTNVQPLRWISEVVE